MKLPERLAFLLLLTSICASAAEPGDALLERYFELQVAEIERASDSALKNYNTASAKKARLELADMLGLNPMPERTPLHTTVTKTIDTHDAFVVENLHFQSSPGMYVTGNLYRPRKQEGKLPAILYVCGHGRVIIDGVSYGNKTHYRHHAEWFARNGYVCLIVDTIQLGELEGMHHGTYRHKNWWWISRGYTPAGVEAWNGIRALDLLQARPEVDPERLGVTGRSGGGAYSWWIAALDQRVKAAVPVAGITSLRNHVVDDCIEGHCDCMFMVNTKRWDFAELAALVAPRALLISNTDKDRIFPLDGVIDVHAKTKRVYQQFGAAGKLGLNICEGPHKDTQQLRVNAFEWFERHLKGKKAFADVLPPAASVLEPTDLKVFAAAPADERTTTIHESFVPRAEPGTVPIKAQLLEHTFGAWPDQLGEAEDLQIKREGEMIHFTSQTPFRLPIRLAGEKTEKAEKAEKAKPMVLHVCTETEWASPPDGADGWLAVRGIGPTRWSQDPRKQTHIRRRFVLLGQTVDAMRVYDIRRAVQALDQEVILRATDPVLSQLCAYAATFEDQVKDLDIQPAASHRDGAVLPNILRFGDFQFEAER